jgi:hypothetical protein
LSGSNAEFRSDTGQRRIAIDKDDSLRLYTGYTNSWYQIFTTEATQYGLGSTVQGNDVLQIRGRTTWGTMYTRPIEFFRHGFGDSKHYIGLHGTLFTGERLRLEENRGGGGDIGAPLSIESNNNQAAYLSRRGASGSIMTVQGGTNANINRFYVTNGGAYADEIYTIPTGSQASPSHSFLEATNAGMYYASGSGTYLSAFGLWRIGATSRGCRVRGDVHSVEDANLAASPTSPGYYLHDSGYVACHRTGATPLIMSRSNNGVIAAWRRAGDGVGSVSVTTTTTTYNTSSDYRLKENERPVERAVERLMALKPYTLNFKVEPDEDVDTFFAHEVQEQVPYAVLGEKDEVDEDGKIVPQQLDVSKLVPLLTAVVQQQQEAIESLQTQVAELQGAS